MLSKMNMKFFMCLCAISMLFLMTIRRQKYQISLLKCILLTICVSAMGLLGTNIMYFLENGSWRGQSFFGAVLFFPILLYPIAMIFRMHLFDLLDYATPAGMAMLGLFKINCYYRGCCSGRVLFYNDGSPFYFPSQMAEMTVAFLLAATLMYMEQKPRFCRKIYQICIILYGTIRFVLNHFRWQQGEFLFGLPAGNLWSIVSVVLGILLLVLGRKRKTAS